MLGRSFPCRGLSGGQQPPRSDLCPSLLSADTRGSFAESSGPAGAARAVHRDAARPSTPAPAGPRRTDTQTAAKAKKRTRETVEHQEPSKETHRGFRIPSTRLTADLQRRSEGTWQLPHVLGATVLTDVSSDCLCTSTAARHRPKELTYLLLPKNVPTADVHRPASRLDS